MWLTEEFQCSVVPRSAFRSKDSLLVNWFDWLVWFVTTYYQLPTTYYLLLTSYFLPLNKSIWNNNIFDLYKEHHESIKKHSAPVMNELRDAAFVLFEKLRFPTPRLETTNIPT